MPHDLEQLEAERARLYRELAQLGDLRRGSIAVNYRRCGNPTCAYCRPEHPGHGPQYLLMTKAGGRSHAQSLRPGPGLEKVEREVANHQRFRVLVQQIIAINEQICDARPVGARSEWPTIPRKKIAQALQRSQRSYDITNLHSEGHLQSLAVGRKGRLFYQPPRARRSA